MSDIKTAVDLINAQGDVWQEFKQVNDSPFDNIEENMRDFKNLMLRKTSPGGSKSIGALTTSNETANDCAPFSNKL